MINPYLEPSMEKYWIPSIAESALFGTKITDDVYQVNIGGDIAFMNGVMKHWFEMEREAPGSSIDRAFIEAHTNGFNELKQHIEKQNWKTLEESSGISKDRMKEFAILLARAKPAFSFGAWDSHSTVLRPTTFHRWQISPFYKDSSAESIAALCRSEGTAVCRVLEKWVPILSSCQAVILTKKLPHGSRRFGAFEYRLGKAIRSARQSKTCCCRTKAKEK